RPDAELYRGGYVATPGWSHGPAALPRLSVPGLPPPATLAAAHIRDREALTMTTPVVGWARAHDGERMPTSARPPWHEPPRGKRARRPALGPRLTLRVSGRQQALERWRLQKEAQIEQMLREGLPLGAVIAALASLETAERIAVLEAATGEGVG